MAYGKIMFAFSRKAKTIRIFNSHLREQKEKVVNTVLKAAKTITVDNAVKVFGISRATFQSWLVQVKFKCENSPKGMLSTCLVFAASYIPTNCVLRK